MTPTLQLAGPAAGHHKMVSGVSASVRRQLRWMFLFSIFLCSRSSAGAQESITPPLQVPPEPPSVASDAESGPDVLQMPFEPTTPADVFAEPAPRQETAVSPADMPRGYTGATGIRPSEQQQTLDFVPVEDRWRIGFPERDRYPDGNPPVDDRFGELGHWWDPYNQNVLKGDYPIIGQHTFLNVSATNFMLHEFRKTPTGTSPFESTAGAGQEEFFGNPDQYFFINNLKLQLSLFHGDAGFRPFDWQIRVAPVFNLNYLDVEELAVVTPNVRSGTTRARGYAAMEEWFVEARLADLSPSYDFLSVRAGSQPFVSDFRGFVFADTNRAVRLFGTRLSNRDQFNLIWFDQT
ncbi:MAG TPA: hypothetical protein DCR20_10985, partial [Planctomycetaceae bacterium]|nr:hypothetical protein [Planctomycetaceae bacterium]